MQPIVQIGLGIHYIQYVQNGNYKFVTWQLEQPNDQGANGTEMIQVENNNGKVVNTPRSVHQNTHVVLRSKTRPHIDWVSFITSNQ